MQDIPYTYRAVVQKWGNSLVIRLPILSIRDNKISERNEVKFMLQNTGKLIEKKRSIPDSWKARISNKSEAKPVVEAKPKLQPAYTVPLHKPEVYPPEVQVEAIKLKRMGLSKSSILAEIDKSETFARSDLSPKTLKEIE